MYRIDSMSMSHRQVGRKNPLRSHPAVLVSPEVSHALRNDPIRECVRFSQSGKPESVDKPTAIVESSDSSERCSHNGTNIGDFPHRLAVTYKALISPVICTWLVKIAPSKSAFRFAFDISKQWQTDTYWHPRASRLY